MEKRYTALVRGPSAIFPRGFLWLIPVWYAVLAGLLVADGRTPSWYSQAALIGLLLAAISLLAVLATMRNNAFVADDAAIWLGLRAGATRRLGRRRKQARPVPWPQIEQVRIRSRYYGAQVDILLGPAAPIIRRANVLAQVAVSVVLLIIPISCMVRSPGLLAARRSLPGYQGLPGYRVRLYDVAPGELRKALAALAPGTVPVVVVQRARAAAREQRRSMPLPGRALTH